MTSKALWDEITNERTIGEQEPKHIPLYKATWQIFLFLDKSGLTLQLPMGEASCDIRTRLLLEYGVYKP